MMIASLVVLLSVSYVKAEAEKNSEINPPESTPIISEEELSGLFHTIAFEGTNLVLKFNDEGIRFAYSINGEYRGANNHGDTITVPIGSSLKLSEFHASMRLTPLPDDVRGCGFKVESKFNAYSFGGKITYRRAYLVFEPGGNGRIKVLRPSVEKVKALGYTKEEINSIEPANSISEEELLEFFDTVTFTGTNLALKFKDIKGCRYSIDGKLPSRTSEHEEIVIVPVGSRIIVTHKHTYLTLSNFLPDEVRGYAFHAERKTGYSNSFGGKETYKEAYLAFEPQRSGNKDNEGSERIKGIRVLPPSVEKVKALGYKKRK